MSTTPEISVPVESASEPRWIGRLRFFAGVVFAWACMHYLIDGYLLSRGWHRPVILLMSEDGVFVGVLAIVALAAIGWVGGLILRSGDGGGVILALTGGLALWAFFGGTMDDWLTLWHDEAGPGTAGPYAALIGDYAVLAILLAFLAWMGGLCADHTARPRDARAVFAMNQSPEQLRDGIVTLLVGTAVYCLVMFIVAGPSTDRTMPGQVYFGAALAGTAAVFVGRQVTGATHPLWYWPMPVLAGVVGLLAACWRPTLPAPLGDINNIPVMWGLARPLPAQMVGVGCWAILINFRSARHRDADS